MSNKTFVGLLILIVIFLFGVVFLFTKQKTGPLKQKTTSTSQSPTRYTLKETSIMLTQSGFSPRIVTIKKGEGIIWINKSNAKATINSADHPTHKKFPEVNLGEFVTTTSITHVFAKIGIYEYHNHYNPQETGTIIVQ
jgi:plastocyanin